MPPKEARQPSPDERQRAIAWLTGRIEEFHRDRKPANVETVLRRLNAREYRNTVRDLLHLNMTMFDPTAGFPPDQTTGHVDNVGEIARDLGPPPPALPGRRGPGDRQGVHARPEAARADLGVSRRLPPAAGDRRGPRAGPMG